MTDMRALRRMRAQRMPMSHLCAEFPVHRRAEVVEAIDALIRNPNDLDATLAVNQVLRYQEERVPLVNGLPA